MAEIQWYYAHEQQQMGPVSSAELKRLAAASQLFPEDLIWREGMEEWAPALRVKGLFPPREAADATPAEATVPAAVPQPPSEPPAPTSDVRLANSFLPATEPPAGPPPAATPVAPPPPATQPAAPSGEAASHDHLGPGLRMILILAQASLWATCVMVVIFGGLLFVMGTVKHKDPADQAASAAISGMLFVGSYVLARSGEHVVRLVEQFLQVRRK